MKPNKLTDETDGAAGTRSGVPVVGGFSRSPAHQLVRVSVFGDRVKISFGTHAASIYRAAEDQPQRIQEAKSSVDSEAASVYRASEDHPQGARSDTHHTVPQRGFMEWDAGQTIAQMERRTVPPSHY